MNHESDPHSNRTTSPEPTSGPELEQELGYERQVTPRPRIYVASLSDYNNGRLHGVWLDAARTADEIHADIAAMLAASKESDAEEFAIHDFDDFGAVRLGEYESIPHVVAIAQGIEQQGYAFAAWADAHEGDPDMLEHFNENYIGRYDSLGSYAEEIIDDHGYQQLIDDVIPESLRPYIRIDTDALARDIYLDGSVVVYPDDTGGIWLFNAD
ncbi:antirestriction protein [Rhodococcus sp. 06-412-2C]|uniref:antirestriction protein ArdA n=1 Tax=unclassified Rhodococcus (in: high G+C Gram-positive bacteria) TaxID=192944 RepID=UPI000B9A5EA2|nr:MULTISPECIES: antirestriction protein ArdA [unclassified Rhodococcus (in: high G+C Gram-positive bacteria)]OZC91808.1 antirestriction protein [Rhodococcus sp. 06-412-2C]OZC92377.1 antirestriction protein [Rhodococcus sp. 06-412-2B]